MNIDRDSAEQKARDYIDATVFVDGGCKIIESKVREEQDGWYFPYQSAEYLKTGDFNKSLVGNWPIFVSRDGQCVGPRRPGMPFVNP